MATKEKDPTYVKIENANLNKLTIRKMSMLYTDYANLVIAIDKLHHKKQALTSKVYKEIADIRDNFKALYEALPKEALREAGVPARKVELPPEEKEFELRTGLESFESLKKEFERIRNQLESIK